MTLPTEGYPPLAPPFLPSVEVITTVPPKRKYPLWLPWLAIVLAPVIAVCAAVGAYTMAKAAVNASSAPRMAATADQTSKPHHKTDPPAPRYDLAGYQAVVAGSDEQAFVAALNQFRADSRHYKFQSLPTDSLSLTGAAQSWLTALRATSPPPGYQASKLDYMMAATLANQAATQTQSGISAADLTALAHGSALATQAKAALARATQAAPQGS
jgi:hypothetical protein